MARATFNIVVLVLLAIVVLVGIDSLIGEDCDTELCCEDCETLAVTRIIDGDTFVSDQGHVRLYGIDAPERGQSCFREATQRLEGLAKATVRVEPGPRPGDRFGRLLFYIYTESGESIEERLVREGLARAWTADGQHRDFLVSLEEKARRRGVGCLW